jgi:hypothetical protein
MQPTMAPERPAVGDVVVYLLGVAGLAACLTLIFLSMRAVMDIGGACAEGGAYQIRSHCPDGVPLLMTVSFPGLFLFGGVMAWRGARLGGPFAGLILFAWPALFLSLGWNFLEYALRGDPDGGIVVGWLICGVVFVMMGGVPLLGLLLPTGSSPLVGVTGPPVRGLASPRRATDAVRAVEVNRLRRSLDGALDARLRAMADDGDLVSRLERLAALHRSGALTDAEFEAAKRRSIDGIGGPP